MIRTIAAVAVVCVSAQPADWLPLIAAGDMVYSASVPAPGLFPAVGNGFLALETGPVQLWQNSWPWRSAGSVHMAGVFNGVGFTTPSHRAQIPSLARILLSPNAAGGRVTSLGAAIDYRRAMFLNRTFVDVPGCASTMVETRTYAHASIRELLVAEIAAWGNGTAPWQGCELTGVQWTGNMGASPDVSLACSTGNATMPSVCNGTTLLAEEPGLPVRRLAVAFPSSVPSTPSTGSLTFSTSTPVYLATFIHRSDLDVPAGQDVRAAAVAQWMDIQTMSADELRAAHEAAWAQRWSSGIELQGNSSLAATVNGSLYDILISMRDDWPYSTSPGGLMTGAYCGHTFWDQATWILPNLVVLWPSLAQGMIEYRYNRVGASQTRAQTNGYDGAFWAWESAFTGLDTAPWRDADLHEHHISGDIPMATRKYFTATANMTWLQQVAWPILNASCQFWECRMQRTDSSGPAPPGYGPACSPKNGSGNWTVKGVIPPDEAAGIVNDSAYTNGVATSTLQWCVDAAALLGYTVPSIWREMAASPYLPLNDTVYPGGPVHNEYTNWDGHNVNQADVALLQYPLGISFPADIARNDLDFWTSHTNWGSFFTGDSAYSVSYLGLGNRTAADAQFALAFQHIEPTFNVWLEVTSGAGTQHFITGAGGYLQSFVFGYPGMRITRTGVLSFTSLQPVVPPLGVTGMRLRGLHLVGSVFDFSFNATALCAQYQAGPQPSVLELRLNGGHGPALALSAATPVCAPLQPVEVGAHGF